MDTLAEAMGRSIPAVQADALALVGLGFLYQQGDTLRSFAPLADAEMIAV